MGAALIGRDDVVAAASTAVAGGASVCLVGPPGVGRSAVLRAVASRTGSGPVVACFSLLADHHLLPLAVAFDDLDVAGAGDPQAIADHIAARQATTTGGRPRALVVDDAQWADGRTLDVLVALVDRLAVVVAAHAGSRAESLLAAAGATIVPVRSLADHLAREVVAATADDLDEERTAAVIEQAAGLPLLLVRLAEAARTGHRRPADDAALGILDDLGDDERRALALLGAGGRPLGVSVVGSGVHGLVARGLATWVGGLGDLWAVAGDRDEACARPTSPLLADLALDALPADDRAALHAVLARHLDDAASAHHHLAAGDLDAARRASDRASRSAVDAAARARAALTAVELAVGPGRADAALEAARALQDADDPLDAHAVLVANADDIRAGGPTAALRAAELRVEALLSFTRDAAAVEEAERALTTIEGGEPAARAGLAAAAAIAHAARLDGPAAVARAAEAMGLATPDTTAWRRARFVLGAAAALLGADSGLDAMAESHAAALAAGELGDALVIGTTLGFALFAFHRTSEARRLLDETAQRARASGRRGNEVHALVVRVSALVWLEQAADHVLADLGELVDDPSCRPHRIGATAMLAQGLGDRGRFDAAARRLGDLSEAVAGVDMERITVDGVATELALLRGDHAAVTHHAERVLAEADPLRFAFHTARLALAWSAVETGRPALDVDGDASAPALAALCAAHRGVVALAEGRFDAARVELLDAVEPLDRLLRRDALRCLVGAAVASARLGDEVHAHQMADAALARCRHHDLDGLRAWAERVLATADIAPTSPGSDPGPSRATGSGQLTARQAEVLARYAAGEPPVAIARALHVSERTVHQHLRAARQRYGAATSAEAAVRWLESSGGT